MQAFPIVVPSSFVALPDDEKESMNNKSLKLVASTFMAVSLVISVGCGDPDDSEATTDDVISTTVSTGSNPEGDSADGMDSMASDETQGTDDASTDATDTTSTDGGTTTGQMGCEDYRVTYPEGPYGTTMGSVLQEMPGMVLPDGTATGLGDIFADTTKVALLLVQAFDT